MLLRVGVYLADGQSREQIAARTGLSAREVQSAVEWLEQVAEKIVHDDEGGP